MLFKNNTNEAVKVRIGEFGQYNRPDWKTVKKGDEIDLPEHYGKNLKFTPVKEDSKETINTPKTDKPDVKEDVPKEEKADIEQFTKQLKKIKGIGKKTVKDIISIYPTQESLEKALKENKAIPLRDDIEEILRNKFN